MSSLDQYMEKMLPQVEAEMQNCITQAKGTGLDDLHHMLAYHLGWEGDKASKQAQGKRVRPMLVLLTAEAVGANWEAALPAAAAVELVHNFSLIHDDIQDDSPLRRGRETVWKKWDIPLAINAGDSMFALAHMALQRLKDMVSPEIALQASHLIPQACLALTQGQHLDLTYETKTDLTTEDYWPMISGKTASLIATSVHLGALIGGADDEKQKLYRHFGQTVGLAFQVYDDFLGIWGDSAVTGKSTDSDLLAGKKSLPVIFALDHGGEFAKRWQQGPIQLDEVKEITTLLTNEGAYDYTKNKAQELTNEALSLLEQAQPENDAGQSLAELAQALILRDF